MLVQENRILTRIKLSKNCLGIRYTPEISHDCNHSPILLEISCPFKKKKQNNPYAVISLQLGKTNSTRTTTFWTTFLSLGLTLLSLNAALAVARRAPADGFILETETFRTKQQLRRKHEY